MQLALWVPTVQGPTSTFLQASVTRKYRVSSYEYSISHTYSINV